MKIKSFQKDHINLEPGLYLQETKQNVDIYDLRFVKPNTRFIPIEAIHTIEHLFATWLKTESSIKDKVISFNPGGCQTMFYLEVFNDSDIYLTSEILNCIDWCVKQDTVPGATAEECGNYKSHDLFCAKQWLQEYREVLNNVRIYTQSPTKVDI